jgi:branched-chain amino acid aminotransferase
MGLINEGKSIYDVVRLSGSRPLFLGDHLDRLFRSLELEDIEPWLSKEDIEKSLETLIGKIRPDEGNIKFVMNTGPEGENHFIAYFVAHRYPSRQDYMNGVAITTFEFERTEPNKKIWRPAFREELATYLQSKKAFEALLIDSNGHFPEASKANVFTIQGNEIITAPDEMILPGITRKIVLDICRELDIPIRMRAVHMDELKNLDALFLTGTSLHVLPVRQIDEITLPVENRTMRELMDRFQKIIEKSSHINLINT